MKMIIKGVLLMSLLSGVASAGPLDILYYGIKGNPDRYVSFDLRAAYGHDTGSINVGYGDYTGFYPNVSVPYQMNDRALKGLLTVPLDENSSLIMGGSIHLQDQAIDGTYSSAGVVPQGSNVRGYTLEAGLKFYIHE